MVYLGLESFHLRKGKFERVVGSAAKLISKEIDLGKTIVNSKIIDSLLSGEEPEPNSVDSSLSSVRGNQLLIDNLDGTTIPVWIGGRITLMMRKSEVRVLQEIRDIGHDSEE